MPVGTVPLSAWSLPDVAPTPPPPAILADRIDPQTGDYASLTKTWGVVDGAVIQTARTKRNTGAAARNHGHEYQKIRYVQPSTALELEAAGRAALAHLVREGVLQVTRVRTVVADGESGNDWAESFLEYRDLLSGEIKRLPLGENGEPT